MFQVFEMNEVTVGRRGHFWVERAALSVSQWLTASDPTPSLGAYFMSKNLLEFPLERICPG